MPKLDQILKAGGASPPPAADPPTPAQPAVASIPPPQPASNLADDVPPAADVPHASAAQASSGSVGLNPGLGFCTEKEISKVPVDFCRSSFDKPCLTGFEMKYMHWHGNNGLNEGLNILRAPGCFPHGTTVGAMGYYRTGSTLLFNVARLWAAAGAGVGGMVSGFNCFGRQTVNPTPTSRKESKCTIVCKDHEWRPGVADNANTILMSHRDPWESVCSRKMMDMWCKDPPKELARKYQGAAAAEYKGKCLASDPMQRTEAVTQCAALMQMQASIYAKREGAGKRVDFDVSLTDFFADPETQIAGIGRAIGICEAALTNRPLIAFLKAMTVYLHDKPDKDMGITRMHDTHSTKKRDKQCSELMGWMRSDMGCSKWIDGNASAATNSVLRG